MKIMKSLFLFIIILANQPVFSQQLGLNAGVNLSYFSKFDEQQYSPLPGVNSGLCYEFPGKPLFKIFYFDTGLNFQAKGNRSKYDYTHFIMSRRTFVTYTQKTSTRINYINIPIKVSYPVKLRSRNLILTTGLYFSLGLSGYFNSETLFSGKVVSSSREKISWTYGQSYDYLNRSDYGFIVSAALQKNHFRTSLTYERGLQKELIITNSFSISGSYYFQIKKIKLHRSTSSETDSAYL